MDVGEARSVFLDGMSGIVRVERDLVWRRGGPRVVPGIVLRGMKFESNSVDDVARCLPDLLEIQIPYGSLWQGSTMSRRSHRCEVKYIQGNLAIE